MGGCRRGGHLRRAAELDRRRRRRRAPGAAKPGPRRPPPQRSHVGGVRPYRRRAGAGGPWPRAGHQCPPPGGAARGCGRSATVREDSRAAPLASRHPGGGVDARHVPADGVERFRELGRPPDVPPESLPPRAVAAGVPLRLDSHLLGEFMPVTWMSYTLDRMLWGLHAPGLSPDQHHPARPCGSGRVALARHLLASRWERILWAARDRLGAAAAALLFAVHPLRVEAVAWVSARGTVLGGLFLSWLSSCT